MRKSMRPIVSLVAAAALIAAALFVPLPWYVEAPLVVEPAGVRHVYAATTGGVQQVHVRPGDRVRRGQLLLELTNPAKQDRFETLATARDVQQVEVTIHQAAGDAAQETLALENVRALTTEVNELRSQLERLRIFAPCDGVVVAPPPVDSPPSSRRTLPNWHGTPLDPENSGCQLEAGAHVLSIAPAAHSQAVLLIDQSSRHDFTVGGKTRLKFDHLPGRTFEGVVEQIAAEPLDLTDANTSLESRALRLAARDGLEAGAKVAYRATVDLDDDTAQMLPGSRGKARRLVFRRSAAGWLWLYACKTFQFRM